jgi:hypothetical protein
MNRAPTYQFMVATGFRDSQVTESLPLPDDHRAGLHKRQDLLPSGPEPGELGPQQAIGRTEPRPMDGLLVDGELVTQREVFQVE